MRVVGFNEKTRRLNLGVDGNADFSVPVYHSCRFDKIDFKRSSSVLVRPSGQEKCYF